MIRVRLRAVGQFEQLLGRRETSVDMPDDSTVLDLLRLMDTAAGSEAGALPAAKDGGSAPAVSSGLLALLYDSSGRQTSAARIFLNGRDVRFLPEENLVLRPEDTVLLLPLLAGG